MKVKYHADLMIDLWKVYKNLETSDHDSFVKECSVRNVDLEDASLIWQTLDVIYGMELVNNRT